MIAGERRGPRWLAHALRMPLETAAVAGLTWLLGALVVGVVSAPAFPDPRVGVRTGVSTLLAGLVTGGVTYLLVARVARGCCSAGG